MPLLYRGGASIHGVKAEQGRAYGLGKLADIYVPRDRGRAAGTVLLWHGVGPDERGVLAPLARQTAAHGVAVIVPDWRSDAPDGGRAQLLASLTFAREQAAELSDGGLVLAGWSRGGRAAAGIGVNPAVAGGWRPSAVVCLGSGFTTPAPTTGTAPVEDLAAGGVTPVPFWLVHGSRDPVVSVEKSRAFAAALRAHGWPAELAEPPTDHAGVVMAEYDPELGRCEPATAAHAVRGGRLTAEILARAATESQGGTWTADRPALPLRTASAGPPRVSPWPPGMPVSRGMPHWPVFPAQKMTKRAAPLFPILGRCPCPAAVARAGCERRRPRQPLASAAS